MKMAMRDTLLLALGDVVDFIKTGEECIYTFLKFERHSRFEEVEERVIDLFGHTLYLLQKTKWWAQGRMRMLIPSPWTPYKHSARF